MTRPVLGDRRYALLSCGAVAFCLVVWVLRRPAQLRSPYVWAEESFIIRDFLTDGWSGAIQPVQGYLIAPANVLVALAAELSFVHMPPIMYVFATAVFLATVAMVVFPDSYWGRGTTRAAMAMSLALVPVNPEVFGVLLYSFWWATLWPLVILGWKRTAWPLAAPLLAVAALSSPAAGALFVVYGIAYLLARRTRDLVGAGILLCGFVLQVVLVAMSPRTGTAVTSPPLDVLEQVLRTAGFFQARWLVVEHPDPVFLAFAGTLFFVFLFGLGLRLTRDFRRHEVLLLASAGLCWTVVSALPAALVSDPVLAGPRYYFLPFVAFGWTLLHICLETPLRHAAVVAVALLVMAAFNLPHAFSRAPHERVATLSWEDELRQCAASDVPVVRVPIYLDGSATFWAEGLDLTPAECRALLS